MDVADVTIVGSGIASTITLVEVFDTLLNNAPPAKKINIVVVEKTNELWKGIPYGSRSSVNALTITSVLDFIYEPERPAFFKWLVANKNDWMAWYREHGGITADNWFKNNLHLIENEDWETVYVPRFLFGNYMQEKCIHLLKTAEEKQLVVFKIIQAEAIDVKVTSTGLHEIILEYPDNTLSKIATHKLVIATGSAPVKKMCNISGDNNVYINDIYEPSADLNIKTLQQVLSKTNSAEDRNILIIGSNASSIELLYLIEGLPSVRKLINKIVIISSSGELPYATSTEALADHPIPNLEKVKKLGAYDIKTLVDAAALDIKLAMKNGANMDYVATIINNTLKLMEVLDEDAKKAFYAIHGVRLRNTFRRAGPDYKNVAQSLLDLQEVTIIKGSFLNTSSSESGVLLNYLNAATGQQQTYPLTFKAIINCSGSDDLDRSSSRLLYNLVNNHICRMNLSRKGFEVNEKFEAAPNIYVMGPLLAGNMNKLIHFWQLENASRLTYLAPYLAKELLKVE